MSLLCQSRCWEHSSEIKEDPKIPTLRGFHFSGGVSILSGQWYLKDLCTFGTLSGTGMIIMVNGCAIIMFS